MTDHAPLPMFLLHTLTAREWRTLLHMADDLRNPQIAEAMYITVKSVEEYHTRIGNKLDLHGAGRLRQFARQHREFLRKCYDKLYPPPILNKIQLCSFYIQYIEGFLQHFQGK